MKEQAREDANKLAEARDNNRDLTNKLEDLRAEFTVAASKVTTTYFSLLDILKSFLNLVFIFAKG